MDKPILPVIAGPTASGKTACAVALCKLIGGEVISADSMQIYSGMGILSAVPTDREMDGVPHHLMGCVDPASGYSADAYREDAKARIAEVKVTDEWTFFEIPFEHLADVDEQLLQNRGYNLALVFAASIHGDTFEGAIGSTLYIDKVRIICTHDE